MGEYTRSLADRGYDISLEDENYREELLEVMQSFRTFDAALDEFILKNGYEDNIADIDKKIKFIKSKFDKAGIPLDLRGLKSGSIIIRRGMTGILHSNFVSLFN